LLDVVILIASGASDRPIGFSYPNQPKYFDLRIVEPGLLPGGMEDLLEEGDRVICGHDSV